MLKPQIEVKPIVLSALYESTKERSETWEKLYPLMMQRFEQGMQSYGVPLITNNGRDAVMDAWEEVFDGILYLMQAVLEKDGDLKSELFDLVEGQIETLLKITDLLT